MHVQEYGRFALGNDRYVTVSRFNGNLLVHIRQYQQNGKGGSYPTKIGITLSPSRFMTLLSFVDTIKSNVERLRNREQNVTCKLHLGGGIFVSISGDYLAVNIRRFFQPEGEITPHPTKKGLALRLSEWDNLTAQLQAIEKLIDSDERPCFESHLSPVTRFHCKECNPFMSYFIQNY